LNFLNAGLGQEHQSGPEVGMDKMDKMGGHMLGQYSSGFGGGVLGTWEQR